MALPSGCFLPKNGLNKPQKSRDTSDLQVSRLSLSPLPYSHFYAPYLIRFPAVFYSLFLRSLRALPSLMGLPYLSVPMR